jgi:hypothetical protein
MAKRQAPSATGGRNYEDEIRRIAAGFGTDQWNEAIRLQCAIRDLIETEVSLLEALQIAREIIRETSSTELTGRFRKQVIAARVKAESDRRAEERRLSDEASKR